MLKPVHSWTRRIVFLLAGVGMVGLGGYLWLQFSFLNGGIKRDAEKALASALKGTVSIGSVYADWRTQVVFDRVEFSVPGNPWEARVKVPRVSLALSYSDLILRKRPLVECLRRITFDSPQVTLVKSSGPTAVSTPGSTATPVPENLPLPILPAGQVFLNGGEFFIQRNGPALPVLTGLDLQVTRQSSGWDLKGSFHPPAKGAGGWAKLTGRILPESGEVHGRLETKDWPLTTLSPLLQEWAGLIPQSGWIDGDIPFRIRGGAAPTYQARLLLRDGALRPERSQGPALTGIQAVAGVRPDEVRLLRPAEFKTGTTQWTLAGVIPLNGQPVSLDAFTDHLHLSDLVHEILQQPKLEAEGAGRAHFSVAGALSQPDLRGEVHMGAGQVGPWKIESLDMKALYKDGILQLEKAEGKLYDGTLSASAHWNPSAGPDGPLAAKVSLKKIRTQPLAELLGLKDWEGRNDLDVELSGSWAKPIFQAHNILTIHREIQGKSRDYLFKNSVKLSDNRLSVSTSINGDTKFESEWADVGDAWELRTLHLSYGNQSNRLKGQGRWPKNPGNPLAVNFEGTDLDLARIPFLQDQFPDVAGKIHLQGQVTGTRKSPVVHLLMSSPALRLGKRAPDPMKFEMTWTPQTLHLNRLEWGSLLKADGTLGLGEKGAIDARVEAKKVPLSLLAGLLAPASESSTKWDGSLTGSLKLEGTTDSPLLEGHARLEDFRAGPFAADSVEAKLKIESDRIRIVSLTALQSNPLGRLDAVGYLQVGASPSRSELKVDLKNFRLAGGPPLEGRLSWSAQTEDNWSKSWNGKLTAPELKWNASSPVKPGWAFPALETALVWKDGLLTADLKVGSEIKGMVWLDRSTETTILETQLHIGPMDLSAKGWWNDFLPEGWKPEGLLQGLVEIPRGPIDQPKIQGNLTLRKGQIHGYHYDQVDFTFTGDREKLSPKIALVQGSAHYELAGSIASPQGFWKPEAQVALEGPFQDETFGNLLTLLGVDTHGKRVEGSVSGSFQVAGTLGNPRFSLTGQGENIRIDQFLVPEADLNLSAENGALILGRSRLSTEGGEAVFQQGRIAPDPDHPGAWSVSFDGEAHNLPLSAFKLNGRLSANGTLVPDPKPGESTFSGKVSFLDDRPDSPGEVSTHLDYRAGVFRFQPSGGTGKLVGVVDLSQKGRLVFKDLRFTHLTSSVSVDGVLDEKGPCQLTSDAQGIRLDSLGKWLNPHFPLSGTGNYHLLVDGTLDDPILNASFNLTAGKLYRLPFNLLDGTLSIRKNILHLGTPENPIELRRAGSFAFTLYGDIPVALTAESRKRIQNEEMDVTAAMPQGDLGLLLLAGFAKSAEGPLDFSAHVTGTLDRPVVNADLDFKGGHLAPKIIAESLDDLRGRIKVRNNLVVIEDLNCRIGQGRVFIWTPVAEDSKMVLDGFTPRYYDLRVRTVTERGVLLNIPAIMRPGEWGEVQFYGSRREDPLLIVGPANDSHVIGTALLDSGHYTFPPVVAKSESGEEITYKELANVNFELNLVSGRDCWYSNDFNTNYLELKVNPGDKIFIGGKDSNRRGDRAGIQSRGSAGSREGWLRYLNREFKIQQASMHIPKGEMPILQGRATDKLKDVDIITPGGSRKSDVDLWVDFNGPIGGVDFKLDSNPRFASGNDEAANQQLLLSYILFGRDMTGYTREDLKSTYEQQVGQQAENAVLEALDRVSSVELSRRVRRLTRGLGGIEINVRSNLIQEAAGRNSGNSSGGSGLPGGGSPVDPSGNSAATTSRSLASVELKKYLDQRMAVVSNFGLRKDDLTDRASFQKQLGLDYDLSKELSLNTRVGDNDDGRPEERVGFSFRTSIPDIKRGRKDDKDPPKLERFDLYPLGPGTLQVLWTTDEVSKAELRVMGDDNQVLRILKPDKSFEYYHEVVLDGLEPDTDYWVQLTVRDLSGNSSLSPKKNVSTPPS